jgi:outer membrane protein assembly factor BamB
VAYRDDARKKSGRLIVAMNGELAALDPDTGEEQWRASIHGAGLGRVALVAESDLVYAASEEELVVCLDAATGEKRWERATIALGRASLTLRGDELFVVRGSHVECLDRRTGESHWAKTVRGMGKGIAALVVADD